ncbi:MAG: beta-galactosidase, partial [bacterium]|nr:beta-galactosidase [bacterium]
MGIEVKKEQFFIDGKPGFLNSGEMHYFRLKRDKWPVFLKKMKDAGLNTVSTYLPWSWHEYEEGKFDFTGSTVPERDIEGFIDEVNAAGLYLTLKPGPVIMAEFLD